jgi:hypothetical protein
MKPAYLGDAKDMAKGYLLAWLRGRGHIQGPSVIPFFTCPETDLKGGAVVQTYTDILGIEPDQLLSRRTWPSSAKKRSDYLTAALGEETVGNTVLLDPDTGLRPSLYGKTRTSKNKYIVTFEDVLKVVGGDQDRIAIVYDESYSHADRKNLPEAVRDKMTNLLLVAGEKKVGVFAYVGMALNLVFVGNQQAGGRLWRIAQALEQLLAGAERRVVRPDEKEVQ